VAVVRVFAVILFISLAFAQSIPDPQVLLTQIRANQHKMDEIRENYTFRRIRTEEDLDDKGSITKTTTDEHEVFFVNGRQIARLIKRNGAALNEAEEKKEQARVTDVIKTAMKADGPAKRGRGNVSLIAEILPMADISHPRRVTLHGRSTLAYDFTGDPHAKASGRNESAAKKLAGTLWFDEADKQVARLEVHFYDNFRIGAGLLASVQKGTSFEVEQSPIGDGLWMQTSNEQHLVARIVVKGVRENVHIKNVDFKKFNVDAVAK
jgi:hypothetical protein